MNVKTAQNQLAEAQRLLEQARDLYGRDNLTDAEREQAKDLRERALKMKRDADVLSEIEREAKGMSARHEQDDRGERYGGFSRFGEFFQAVVDTKSGVYRDPRLQWRSADLDESGAVAKPLGRKALAGTSGAAGGFLIPPGYAAEMRQVMAESSAILPRVDHMQMATRTVSISVVDHTQSLAAGQPPQFGGILTYWEDEAATIGESEPKLRQLTLTARELTAMARINNSLLADSAVSLESFLNSHMGMSGAMQWRIEYAILRGTGVGQPEGILNSGALIEVDRETDDTITYTDLANIENASLGANLVWVAAMNTRAQLRALKDIQDNLLWAGAREALLPTLMGHPIIFTDKVPELGEKGDISLIDFSYYLLGDRQLPTMDVSTEAAFTTNQTLMRLIARLDGAGWMNAPLTLAGTSTELSPFVTLAA